MMRQGITSFFLLPCYTLDKAVHHRIGRCNNQKANNINSKSFLEELGALYLSIGITELYTFTNKKDLYSIGLIDKEGWEKLSIENEQELPVFLANKMIGYVKKNKKAKELSKKWNVREGEIKKHITQMARYITEGIIDVIE